MDSDSRSSEPDFRAMAREVLANLPSKFLRPRLANRSQQFQSDDERLAEELLEADQWSAESPSEG
jgi:hypothetical protein